MNNCLSTANNFHTSINKEIALDNLAIGALDLLTTLSPNLTTLVLGKVEKTYVLYAKWLYKDIEEVV